MSLIKMMLGLTSLFFAISALAHGEDKPGPHGGFIRMPGAFHTEIVPVEGQKFYVYLLDINWKNPSTKDSSLVLTFKKSKQSIEAKCQITSDFYVCEFSKNVDLKKKGKLEVLAQREKQQGNLITYDLPLKHSGMSEDHSMHH